ncbi:hypothetical protein [Ascidiimonas sp. W6]|uniref:hypothetical protein n=1 Tax=Ascidiimonas meishanensis TaxID=3128903 RepID=UPI0030EEE80B
MTDFKNIENIWQQQESVAALDKTELLHKAKKMTKEMKREHFWTQLILLISCIVIIWFFFYISAWKSNRTSIALSIMGAVLLVRLILELLSMRRFKAIKITQDFEHHHQERAIFYKWRRKIHFVFTPLLLLLYIISFISMMPLFKENLSSGFYLYIQISGVFVFFGIGLIIVNQVKRELKILKFLQSVK